MPEISTPTPTPVHTHTPVCLLSNGYTDRNRARLASFHWFISTHLCTNCFLAVPSRVAIIVIVILIANKPQTHPGRAFPVLPPTAALRPRPSPSFAPPLASSCIYCFGFEFRGLPQNHFSCNYKLNQGGWREAGEAMFGFWLGCQAEIDEVGQKEINEINVL